MDPAVLDQLRRAGRSSDLPPGTRLFSAGEPHYDFYFIESGSVRVVDPTTGHAVAELHAGSFLGELGLLMGQGAFMNGETVGPVRALVVPHAALRDLVRTVPEVGDLIVGAFVARRRILIEMGEGGLILVGREDDPCALRLREFAGRCNIAHHWLSRNEDSAEVAALAAKHDIPSAGTVAVVGAGEVLRNPSPRDVARALGLDLIADDAKVYDVMIVGAGPAGLAAAVYSASEGLSTLVIEDNAIGGQAGTSSRIENYLGFPSGVSGRELAFLAQTQAIKFGAQIAAPRRAVGIRRSDRGYSVRLDDDCEVTGRAVVLASGVRYRRLPLDRLAEFEGRGIYYAATDLEARFCRNTEVIIIGGGNSAGQAAMYLSRHADCVHILVRGEGLATTMSSYLSDRIVADPKIRLWTRTEVSSLDGGERLEQVTVANRDSGETTVIASGALFIMIGAAPTTDWLGGCIALDEKGFVLTGPDARAGADGFETSEAGIYAVGDIRSTSVKRVASAVGEGSVVVSQVHRHLAELAQKADRT